MTEAGNDGVSQQRSARAALQIIQNHNGSVDLEILKKIAYLPDIDEDIRVILLDRFYVS